MLLRTDQLKSDYHCYVIGSGPAGMTVAVELARANKRVLILETGESDAPRDDVPFGNQGHMPSGWWNRHSAKALGGTSAIWGGWCTTLTTRDFDNPVVGVKWPITRADLVPYYRRAAPILDRDPSITDGEAPVFPGFVYRPISLNQDDPTRFARKYKDTYETSATLDVALGCTVIGFGAPESRNTVRSIDFVHQPSGRRGSINISPSQQVVVAAGAIANAQLLLQPRPDGGVPVGNESGLAGKFLMEHPHFVEAGETVLDLNLDAFTRPAQFGTVVHALVPDDELMAKYGLLSSSIDCQHPTPDQEVARFLTADLKKPFFHYRSTLRTEMLPTASNRVFLTGDRDAHGYYTPTVRCVFGADDLLNGDTVLRVLGESLIRQRKGRVRVFNDRIYRDAAGGGHLMGTTRMGTSKSNSVVDGDCRVHGYDNFSIAGSSVFATSGYAHPTFTIVALALRLADRLKAG